MNQGNADNVSQLASEDYDMEEQITGAIDTEGSKQVKKGSQSEFLSILYLEPTHW